MYKKLLMALTVIASMNAGATETINNSSLEMFGPDTSRVVDLDEVIVVAQPKENYKLRLQSVSSSVFSFKELENLNVRGLKELSNYIPTFVMPQYGSRLTSAMYIRGIGSRINYPAVGMYVDGIPYVSKNSYNSHLYGIDRIDVLRGPQGTLYGQNTMGGLVRIYSKNPMNYQGTDIKLGIGSHFYRNAEFAHYNKVSDKFAFSIAGFYDGQNGFFKNVTLDKKADLINEAGGKVRMIYAPTQRLKFDFNANYEYVNQNAFPYIEYGNSSNDVKSDVLSCYKRNMFNTGVNISYEADKLIFNSITSYQFLKDNMTMDIDNTAQSLMYVEQRQKQNAITQELVLKSIPGGRWQWTSGVFGSYQWLKTDAPVYFEKAELDFIGNQIQSAMRNAMIANGAPETFINNNVFMTVKENEMIVPGKFSTPQLNLGLYHQSSFDFTDRLTGTLGMRFEYEHGSVDYDTRAAMSFVTTGMCRSTQTPNSSHLVGFDNHDYYQLLPKFALSYKIFDNGSNVYASVSKGFRSGGYNIQLFSDILSTELQNARGEVTHTADDYGHLNKSISYKPESSWNYEVGTHLNMFDGKVQADFSTFYMRVLNQQLSVFAGEYGFGRMMVNAGKSSSCGVEIALRGGAFNNHLQWSVNYGFTHSTFREYKDSVRVNGVYTLVDYKDKHVPFVPTHTFAATADYRFDIKGCGSFNGIVVGANVNGNGKTYWDESNTMSQKLYAVMGAHVDADFGRFYVSFWGRNITNTKYDTFAISSSTGNFSQHGNPVQIGVDLKLHI